MELPKKLEQKLEARKANNTLRKLGVHSSLVDFSSNDYLGFSKSEIIFTKTHQFLNKNKIIQNGATGSRLLSGNYSLFSVVETMLSQAYKSESALLFNSGYNANMGFFSCVPQRGDIVLYDEYIHASIRDGISLSNAKGYKFKHNNFEELEKLINRHSKEIFKPYQNIYIVTESVFSMDGDSPDLVALSNISKKHNAFFIVDEAHAVGVLGEYGEGLVQALNLEHHVFARIITFGKALGCHGAVVVGSENLIQYLINFSRNFIYTTALSPHSLVTIKEASYQLINASERAKLHENIRCFKAEITNNKLENNFIESNSAIHCCLISGNKNVKTIAFQLQNEGFNVKPILSPTVPKGQERLRFCLHSYNSNQEILRVLKLLAKFVALLK